MHISSLVAATRSVRRFQEQRLIEESRLREWVDLARLGGSARNAQVLKYMVVSESRQREQLFPLLGWAGYLPDWQGPVAGERPSAYILCLLDRSLLKGAEHEAHVDCGIASQNILLAAAEQGVAGCRIGAFPAKIDRLVQLEEPLSVLLVLALGYPAESVTLEEVGVDGDIRYWRDQEQGHHVPKRSLAEVLVAPTF